jgi:hypothetical protein
MDPSIRDTIARVAQEEGIDPSYALAVADRESGFNPNARASRTIAGLYQMTGTLRNQYGAGDSADPATQTRAFAAFTKDNQAQMASQLGRQPTGPELYMGHFWGANRAAGVIAGQHAGLAPSDVFTPNELAQNPELAKGSSAGGLAGTIMADISRRQAKYGGNSDNPIGHGDNSPAGGTDFASYGDPKGFNFAQFGQSADDGMSSSSPAQAGAKIDTGSVIPGGRPGTEIDLAQFGQPAQPPAAPPATAQV